MKNLKKKFSQIINKVNKKYNQVRNIINKYNKIIKNTLIWLWVIVFTWLFFIVIGSNPYIKDYDKKYFNDEIINNNNINNNAIVSENNTNIINYEKINDILEKEVVSDTIDKNKKITNNTQKEQLFINNDDKNISKTINNNISINNISNNIEKNQKNYTSSLTLNNTSQISRLSNFKKQNKSTVTQKKLSTEENIFIIEKHINNDLLLNYESNTSKTIDDNNSQNTPDSIIEINTPIENQINDNIFSNINSNINSILNNLNSEVLNTFTYKTLKNDNLVLENWIRYTYIYTNYKNFWKSYSPTQRDIENSWFNEKTTLLVLDENLWVSFVTDFEKVKLINDSIISSITNKHNFLLELRDDKKHIHTDTDNLFNQLKSETQNLTNWLSQSTKIQKIYDYILKNISYSSSFDINNKKIFSGIETYQNKNWICWWYAKLGLYMLSFAWVEDAWVIKGDVIDAKDFPNVWHAWIKIWNYYYDPTFDDPSWITKTKSFSQYKYFWLPQDLFYANKYSYWTLPEYLKSLSIEERKKIIQENLQNLLSKYENQNYLLLESLQFKRKNNIGFDEKITIEKLKKFIPYFEVSNYKYLENNSEIIIQDIDFFTINDSNIELLLEQINYNFDWYKLFKWDNWDYRLAYNIKTT